MNRLRMIPGLAIVAALTLPAALPAQAERLVIEGRAAQALHCATMMAIVGGVVHEAGLMSDSDFELMAFGAVRMMEHVPGTEAQKMQAMRQRGKKILETRTLDQLADEFDSTFDWCMKKFF
ncbi:MAG: hypothetical protein IPL38_16035 [Rhodobacter sp.]|jgi:hypothetical protein|nr:hypothetical protein [Rhodobacter sp.]MBK8440936.1 hypothetical protein [Rhodobacter sp.]